MPAINIPKYRPVLSEHDITHILKLCRKDGTKDSMSIVATLAQLEFKILQNAAKPAHTAQVKESLEESLGFIIHPEIPQVNLSIAAESLYQIWLTEPQSLSANQIAKVREWRYENNKMTMDEEKLFEKEVLGI